MSDNIFEFVSDHILELARMGLFILLAVFLLSSCSGQPAPQPAVPASKPAAVAPKAASVPIPGRLVTPSTTQPVVTLSVLIGPIIHFVQRPGEQLIGRDYVEGSTKQWAIRALPWPCEQPPMPNMHIIVEATEQPDKTWVAAKCIGDYYDAPYICVSGMSCG